jgi:hypothetical protein
MPPRRAYGFTLVELAILILIIGLISSGILVGRSLVRAAELRKLYSGYTDVVSAMNTFRTKYNCLAGDCPNATDLFGRMAGCPDRGTATVHSPAFVVSDVRSMATCNGDGDMRMDVQNTMYEMTTFWQQLAAAGLIAGSYTGGISQRGGSIVLPGANCPNANSAANCWIVLDGDDSVWFKLTNGRFAATLVRHHLGTVLMVGQDLLAPPSSGIMTPTEAQSYDGKYDDGNPVTGRIQAAFGTGGCTTAQNAFEQSDANKSAAYAASGSTKDVPACNHVYLTTQ